MKKWMKILLKALPLIVLAVALFWIKCQKKDKGLKIADTATIVTEIRALSSLTSACYYNEAVLSRKKPVEVLGNTVPYVQDEICVIAKGKVRAGIDLSKIREEDILARGDTLEIKLPQAEVFEVIVNPSDLEIFVEEGKWSHDEVADMGKRAAGKIRAEAVKAGILKKADDSARFQLGRMLNSLGYNEIIFVPTGLSLPDYDVK